MCPIRRSLTRLWTYKRTLVRSIPGSDLAVQNLGSGVHLISVIGIHGKRVCQENVVRSWCGIKQ
jgi:hypothetical protein